jgi:hypothetical protein
LAVPSTFLNDLRTILAEGEEIAQYQAVTAIADYICHHNLSSELGTLAVLAALAQEKPAETALRALAEFGRITAHFFDQVRESEWIGVFIELFQNAIEIFPDGDFLKALAVAFDLNGKLVDSGTSGMQELHVLQGFESEGYSDDEPI